MIRRSILVSSCVFFLTLHTVHTQEPIRGSASGIVLAASNKKPMEMVNVIVRTTTDSMIVTGMVTDAAGKFDIGGIAPGRYFLTFSILGYDEGRTNEFILDGAHKEFDAGQTLLKEGSVNINEVTVTAQKSVATTTIDRKVYNVQQDIMSKAGSVSDLLQHVPSVQVDIDGGVSLRGSDNVLMLINGKPSPLLSAANRADALQQMPAEAIERIEVITNPSAKFKPDGTAGIINIVTKKDVLAGVDGAVGANIGNNNRYNGSARLHYGTGPLSLFGNYSPRQDERNGISTDSRTMLDSLGQNTGTFRDYSTWKNRPLVQTATVGADYHFDEATTVGISGSYFSRDFTRNDISAKLLRNASGATTNDYDRKRFDRETQSEFGYAGYFEREFSGEDHKLRISVEGSRHHEQEDNHYSNIFRVPSLPATYDNTLIRPTETNNEATLEYTDTPAEHTTFEAGYVGDFNKNDMDFYGAFLDTTTQQFVRDPVKTNRFVYHENIHALYATYGTSLGGVNALAGLRAEQSYITSDLVSSDSVFENSYLKLYPTLHLSYALSELTELQLNYSRRVNRPESDDLNPFPEYQDPRNIRAGNPNLLPEFIHSVEMGAQLQTEFITFVPSVFYRNKYNGFTTITRALNDSTLLTTRTNLATDQSAGLELVLTGSYRDMLNANASVNAFYETIDATNLGFGTNKSTTTWSGSLNLNLNLVQGSMLQINSNYRSSRLTPQGETLPSFVVNLGMRQEFFENKLTLTATLSDALRTQDRRSKLDTPLLHQETVGTRDHQIFYVGLTYHFGAPAKKEKERSMQFDEGQ